MAENADDRASVRSGGGGVKPAPVVPKKIVRPKLRPADLPKPTTAPLDYDTLYTGDPGMFMSPYQVGPRPSTYSPSSFPGGGDPMLADPPRGTPSMGTSFGSFGNPVDMSRDVPLSDQRRPDMLDVQPSAPSRPSYAGDPYAGDRVPSLPPQLGGRGAEVSGGGGVSDDDVYRRAPSASEYLQEQRLLDSFPDGGQDTFIDDETYETAAFGDTGFGKFLNNYVLGDKTQLETTSGGGVASLPISPSGGGRGNVVEALGDRAAYTPPTQNAPEGVLSFMDPVGRVATEGEKAAGLDKTGAELPTNALDLGIAQAAEGFGNAGEVAGNLFFEGAGKVGRKANDLINYLAGTGPSGYEYESGLTQQRQDALDAKFRAEGTALGATYDKFVRDPLRANTQDVYERLPQETKDRVNADLTWDNLGTQLAVAGPSAGVSIGAALISLPAAITVGLAQGIGGMESTIRNQIEGEFSSGRLQETDAYKKLTSLGLSPEQATSQISSSLVNKTAPLIAPIAATGGVITNQLLKRTFAPKILQNLVGQNIATRGITTGLAESGTEILQNFGEMYAPSVATGGLEEGLQQPAPTSRQLQDASIISGILGFVPGYTAGTFRNTGDVGPTVQRAADIDAVGTSPYTAIAAPETTVPVAQIAPPQAAAADVISGKPIITPAPEPVVQLEGYSGSKRSF